MKTHDLEESEAAGNSDPLNVRFKIDGKRVTRAEFDALKRASGVTLDTFQTVRSGGVVTFYCVARVPDPVRPECPAHLRQTSLGDCERFYKEGRFPYSDLVAYLKAWNATPGRFTQAVWRDGAIRQYDPETSGSCYRIEAPEFGAATC